MFSRRFFLSEDRAFVPPDLGDGIWRLKRNLKIDECPQSLGVVAESREAGTGGRGCTEPAKETPGVRSCLAPTLATLFKSNNLLPPPKSGGGA